MVAADDEEHESSTHGRRITAPEWEHKPVQQPMTAAWDQRLPYSELPNFLLGVRPRDMDDRWYIYVSGPNAQGNGTLHMYRSWTGYKCFEAKFVMNVDHYGRLKSEDGSFTEITWETDNSRLNGVNEQDAKDMVKGVCNSVLDIELP